MSEYYLCVCSWMRFYKSMKNILTIKEALAKIPLFLQGHLFSSILTRLSQYSSINSSWNPALEASPVWPHMTLSQSDVTLPVTSYIPLTGQGLWRIYASLSPSTAALKHTIVPHAWSTLMFLRIDWQRAVKSLFFLAFYC